MTATIHPWLSDDVASEFKGYIRIMRATRGAPLTLREIAASTKLKPKALHHILPAMRASSLIGIKSWKLVGRQWSPQYGWGIDEAEKLPVLGKPKARCIAFASILRTLEHASTVAQIVEETGVSDGTVRRCLRVLKAHRMAYVCAWQPTAANNYVGAWRRGRQSNAPWPERESRQVINARQEAKKRQRRQFARLAQAIAGNTPQPAALEAA